MVDSFLKAVQDGLIRAFLIMGLLGFTALLLTILMVEELRRAAIKWLLFLSGLVAIVIIGYQIATQATAGRVLTAETLKAAAVDLVSAIAPLIILGASFFLFLIIGLAISKSLRRVLYLLVRRRYLTSLIRVYQPKIATLRPIGGRVNLEKWASGNLLVTGTSGMGKSTLLKQLLISVAEHTLKGDSDFVPIFIDLDTIVEFQLPLPSRKDKLFYTRNSETFLTRWILREEADKGNLYFILDGSARLCGRSSREILYKLSAFVRDYTNCTFVLALPSQVVENENTPYSLDAIFHNKVSLEGLSKMQMQELLDGLVGEDPISVDVYEKIVSDPTWFNLARRPLILSLIAKYQHQIGGFPTDLVTLLRETSYPGVKLLPTDVEIILSRLALQMTNQNRFIVDLKELKNITMDAINAAVAKESTKELLDSDVFILIRDKKKKKTLVKFSHPLFMAFFVALAWRDGPVSLPSNEEIAEFTKDPIRGDAFVFFNHLESNPVRLADQLSKIAARGDIFSLALATNCVFAQPELSRPPFLVNYIAERLIQRIADFDVQSAQAAWLLLENWKPEERLNVYLRVLANMGDVHRGKTLSRIGALAITELRAIFRNADESLSREAGNVWVELNRADALKEFAEVYNFGPDAKRYLAVEMMGYLLSKEVEDTLQSLFYKDVDPQMRIVILRSLYKADELRALRRGFNPYEAGRPIMEPDKHFGRQAVITKILDGLPNHFAVYGPRRIGKTSLLYQLQHHIASMADSDITFLPVFVNLQRVNPSDLFYSIMHLIIKIVRTHIDSLELIVDIKRDSYDDSDFIEDLEKATHALRTATGKSTQIVLLVDEGDKINELDIEAQRRLRGIFMEEVGHCLTMIWSGMRIQYVRDYYSAWYNLFAEEIPLGALDEAEARKLISKPVKGVYCYADEAIQRILDLTKRKPFMIQRLCHSTIDTVLSRVKDEPVIGLVTITLNDVEASRDALPLVAEGEL